MFDNIGIVVGWIVTLLGAVGLFLAQLYNGRKLRLEMQQAREQDATKRAEIAAEAKKNAEQAIIKARELAENSRVSEEESRRKFREQLEARVDKLTALLDAQRAAMSAEHQAERKALMSEINAERAQLAECLAKHRMSEENHAKAMREIGQLELRLERYTIVTATHQAAQAGAEKAIVAFTQPPPAAPSEPPKT